MGKKLTFDFVKNKFEEINYTLLETEYINNWTKMKCICNNHPDLIQYKTYGDVSQKYGCMICGGKKKLEYDFIKKEFEKAGYELLDIAYKDQRTKMKYRCPNHPNKDLYISYNKLKQGEGCYFCGREKTQEAKRTSLKFVKSEFEKRGYELLEKAYFNCKVKMKYKCLIHTQEQLEITWDKFFYKGQGCPICNETNGEKKIRKYLIQKNIKLLTQKTFEDCKHIGKLKFDFYLPDYNLCIEYNGQQHYKVNNFFGGDESFESQKLRDQIKIDYCKKKNIQLLIIPYTEFKNIESILNEKLGFKNATII